MLVRQFSKEDKVKTLASVSQLHFTFPTISLNVSHLHSSCFAFGRTRFVIGARGTWKRWSITRSEYQSDDLLASELCHHLFYFQPLGLLELESAWGSNERRKRLAFYVFFFFYVIYDKFILINIIIFYIINFFININYYINNNN